MTWKLQQWQVSFHHHHHQVCNTLNKKHIPMFIHLSQCQASKGPRGGIHHLFDWMMMMMTWNDEPVRWIVPKFSFTANHQVHQGKKIKNIVRPTLISMYIQTNRYLTAHKLLSVCLCCVCVYVDLSRSLSFSICLFVYVYRSSSGQKKKSTKQQQQVSHKLTTKSSGQRISV